MAVPLRVQSPTTTVINKKGDNMASSRMSYQSGPSVTMKNRVESKSKVKAGSTKAPLEAVGANAASLKGGTMSKRMNYASPGLSVTPKGYPRGTFKGAFPANKPNKINQKNFGS